MKKIIYLLIFVATVGFIAFTLYNNKAKSADKIVAADRIDDIPVTVETVQEKQLTEKLSLVGVFLANSDVNIASEAQGRITAVYVQTGDFKPAGSVIATVDDELRQAAVLGAQANFDKTKADLDRFEALKREKTVTEAQYDGALLAFKLAKAQLMTAERQLRDAKITTLASGVVTSRMVDVGANVNVGTPIANIVDISTLKIKVNLAEKDVAKLKAGDKVEVSTEVYPGEIFTGVVRSISAKGDDSHTFPVEIIMQNNKVNPLRAGMFARVNFTNIAAEKSVVIPRSALTGSVRDAQVYVVNNGKAEIRNVQIGVEFENELEILRGVAGGETVVTNGQNNLRNGVKVIVQK
ncbi:efflux RND transporter periplasmic adaptor subunit [Ignavibacteria bacterium]|nr:efflux RND transporter periplasmic adaptor subunit [Bacteroidota bacterium]MCZ2133027.1 efflux RND transporter periplasmic adaptor subunit [Bacteroidota bacterium]